MRDVHKVKGVSMSDKLTYAKVAVKFVAGAGVSKVVNDIISTNTVADDTTDKVKIAVGSLVLGSMIADAASNHVERRMNKVADWLNSRRTEESTEVVS
jgi:hypothetical protein